MIESRRVVLHLVFRQLGDLLFQADFAVVVSQHGFEGVGEFAATGRRRSPRSSAPA